MDCQDAVRDSEVSKWLKAKRQCAGVQVKMDGVIAETDDQAVEMIKERWRKVCNRYESDEQREELCKGRVAK